MFKIKLFTAIACAAFLGALSPAQAGIMSPLSPVREILQMGQNWGNGNRGGYLFRTQNMPPDIDYFIVRPGDVALNQYLSEIELSLVNGRQMNIEYNRTNPGCTNPAPGLCNTFEGDVSSMWLY